MSEPQNDDAHRTPGRPVLVSAVVAVGLLGIVVALCLPAVSKVRDGADKMLCGANLRQLAILLHDYHNDHDCLPPGYLGPVPNEAEVNPANGPHLGWLACVLPYLTTPEQPKKVAAPPGVLPDLKQTELTVEPGWWTQPARLAYASKQLRMLRCPMSLRLLKDEAGLAELAVAVHHYHVSADQANQGIRQSGWSLPISPATQPICVSDYVGVSGAAGLGTNPEWKRYSGILVNRRAYTLAQLTAMDGTSNTLMIGETLGGYRNGQRAILHTWMGSSAMGVYLGVAGVEQQPSIHQFSSVHPRIVQFAYGDASVRGVRFDVMTANDPRRQERLQLLYELAGLRDGNPGDVAAIMD